MSAADASPSDGDRLAASASPGLHGDIGVPGDKSMSHRALILGGNYARIIGFDTDAARAQIADDEFARERAEHGRREAYSAWREHLAAHPAEPANGTPHPRTTDAPTVPAG